MDEKILLDFYWKYFELHSKQRMQIINFYITVIVVLYGGLFALNQLAQRWVCAETFVAAFIIFISYCFYRLDRRTSELIHCCEDRIKALEKNLDDDLRLVTLSDSDTRGTKTYSSTFKLLLIVVGASGALYIILLALGWM